jgi:hypothetical protein
MSPPLIASSLIEEDTKMRRVTLLVGAAFCVILAMVTLAASQSERPPDRPRVPGTTVVHTRNVFRIKPFVRGYIAVRVPVGARSQLTAVAARQQFQDIFLPRVKVHLLNLANNSKSDAVTTDLSGRFTIPAAAGRYRVCWEARGFAPGCSALGAELQVLRVEVPAADDEHVLDAPDDEQLPAGHQPEVPRAQPQEVSLSADAMAEHLAVTSGRPSTPARSGDHGARSHRPGPRRDDARCRHRRSPRGAPGLLARS